MGYYEELWKNKRDLNSKLATYKAYVDSGKEPPAELIGSIDSLQRLIESEEILKEKMDYFEKTNSSSNESNGMRR